MILSTFSMGGAHFATTIQAQLEQMPSSVVKSISPDVAKECTAPLWYPTLYAMFPECLHWKFVIKIVADNKVKEL